MKNLFIVIDGIDGSGKSEIVKMLHNYLFSKNKKYNILTTREPTNGEFGIEIREKLRSEQNPLSNAEKLLELFVKDREEHLEKTILPFLNKSNNSECNIVICDRYFYSNMAFQQTQGIELKRIIEKNKGFKKPDIAFILDVEPETALQRIRYREKEKFEQIDFMKKLRKNFLALPKSLDDNIKVIDASKSIKEVFESVKKEVDKLLK